MRLDGLKICFLPAHNCWAIFFMDPSILGHFFVWHAAKKNYFQLLDEIRHVRMFIPMFFWPGNRMVTSFLHQNNQFTHKLPRDHFCGKFYLIIRSMFTKKDLT